MKSTFGKSLIQGRKDYSPKAKTILETYGGLRVNKIVIDRTPLPNTLMAMLNVITFGEFKKRMKNKPYDKLFHLRMDIHTDKGVVSVEKNEVVTLTSNPKTAKKAETILVQSLPKNLTLSTMLETTRKAIGEKKFWTYTAKRLNCQQFLIDVLNANNLGDESHRSFVKQDTNSLFDKYGYLRKTSNTLTDIASRFDVLKQGGKISQDSPMKARKLLREDLYKVHKKYDSKVQGRRSVGNIAEDAKELRSNLQGMVGSDVVKSIMGKGHSPANISGRVEEIVGSGLYM